MDQGLSYMVLDSLKCQDILPINILEGNRRDPGLVSMKDQDFYKQELKFKQCSFYVAEACVQELAPAFSAVRSQRFCDDYDIAPVT